MSQEQTQGDANQLSLKTGAVGGAGAEQPQQYAGAQPVQQDGQDQMGGNVGTLDPKTAQGLAMGGLQQPNAATLNNATGSPDQLQAIIQLQQQQQQAQMSTYLQQLQQLQALQQLQQQQSIGGLQRYPVNQSDPQQMQPSLAQQQQILQQAALLHQQQQYNQLLSMTAPQQLLGQGFGLGQGGLNPQQMQGLFTGQFPANAFNQAGPSPFMAANQMYGHHQQRPGPSDQQNILNINITPQHISPSSQPHPRKGGADYAAMEPDTRDDGRHLSPIEVRNDYNRDLSAPKHSLNPKLNALNIGDKQPSQKGRAQSRVPRAGEDHERKDSHGRKKKSRNTYVQNVLAKETAASQKRLGGKVSVRQQIKKQIYQLGKLEEAIKEKQKRKASQSSARPNTEASNTAAGSSGLNTSPIRNNQQIFASQLPVDQQQALFNQYMGSQQLGASSAVLGQQSSLLPFQQLPGAADGSKSLTLQINQQQASPDASKAPDMSINLQNQAPKISLPAKFQDSAAKEQLAGSIAQSVGQENGVIGQTEIFDNAIAQESSTPPQRQGVNADLAVVAASTSAEKLQPMASPAASQRSHQRAVPRKDGAGAEQPIDRNTVNNLIQEEADLQAEIQKVEMELQMDEQEIDDLIKKEQEFIEQKDEGQEELAKSGRPLAQLPSVGTAGPIKDPLVEAEELLKQGKDNLPSQRSMTSSKKLRIKVSDDQRKALKSAKSNASQGQQPVPEGQALSIDQMIADVDAVAEGRPPTQTEEKVPEVPLEKSQAQPEASLGQLEQEIQQVVDKKSIAETAPKIHHQKEESALTVPPMDLSQMDLELTKEQQAKNKSAIMPPTAEKVPNFEEGQADKAALSAKQPGQLAAPEHEPPVIVPEGSVGQPSAAAAPEPLKAKAVAEPEPANAAKDQPGAAQEEPVPPAPEDTEGVLNLCDTRCLPAFEYIVKLRSELTAMDHFSDSENDDTDGYLSEEIDIQKYRKSLFRDSKPKVVKPDAAEKTEKKLSETARSQSDVKSEKVKKLKEKQKTQREEKDDKDDDDEDKDKQQQVTLFKESYETMTLEQIRQSMYLSQRGLLYQVRQLQQKKGHKFLVRNSDHNLYEFLQEHKEIQQIDKTGIFEINHPKKIYFEIFVIILAIYNCFGIPLEICFQPVTMEATEFVVFNSIIDFIFGIDIYVQFKTTFYDPLSGDEVFDKKVIFWTYLKGRFIVDFMATVPFDNITYAITRQRISILPLFSLLKLIRITRLGRIIERMNVREHVKLMMKLSQIIFMLIMFIHCQACAWFYIVSLSKDWTAPLDGIDPNNDLYNDSIVRKYLISVYYSILLLTCNDITPIGQWKIFFCASAVTLGAIINSIIFGNMALIIQNLNQKNSEFQESIDLANTAMKNMDMPKELQQDVVSYLQYTQQSQNGQQEFEYFYGCLSPTLRNEVIQLIFKEVTTKCELFEENVALIDFFIKSLQLMLLDPEYPLVNQGEKDNRFFFIKSGECEVYVKDPHARRDVLVRTLKGGNFFGEVSLLTGQPRTASVRPKIYAMIGFFQEQKFEEMVFMFPEVRSALQKHFFTYNDINRQWQREMLKNIQFMLYLPENILDEMTISLSVDMFDENQEIFKQGQISDKVYILSRGKIEIFLTIPEGELFLDVITEPGSVLSQISILNRMKLTYSARAKEDTEMLSISYEKLQEQRALNHMQPLNQEIEKYFEKTINPLELGEKHNLICFLDYQKKRPAGQKKLSPAQRMQLLRDVANRQLMICRFQYKKDNILSDLIAELKKMNMDDQQKSLNKMKELVKSIAPIIVSKLKKLVSNRIKQVHQESLKQNQSIKNIHSIIQLINEQHKQKQQNLPPPPEKKSKSSKKMADDDASSKGDKSPSRKYGVNKELQGIEEKEEEENRSSEDSVDLSQEDGEY